VIPWSIDVSWHDGEVFRALAARGQLLGGNDLWIAATALSPGFTVVTNNANEFRRVPGLMVEPF
jgi:tRNA(fMet)-specific endonuclease VapC